MGHGEMDHHISDPMMAAAMERHARDRFLIALAAPKQGSDMLVATRLLLANSGTAASALPRRAGAAAAQLVVGRRAIPDCHNPLAESLRARLEP
jgi:hypothetical protein